MAETAFRAAILSEAPRFGLALGPEIVDRFSAHYELLAMWNRKLNLTRVIEPAEAATFHFLESAFLSTAMDDPASGRSVSANSANGKARVVDIGSGAGFPGLPLACLWPDCEFVLVEPHGKRVVFLKEAIRKLGLKKVTVLSERYEKESIRATDVIVSRALEGLEQLLESIVTSAAERVVLYTDPAMLEKANELAPERALTELTIPGTVSRRIGILSK